MCSKNYLISVILIFVISQLSLAHKDSVELFCVTDSDCKTYKNKIILATCEEQKCICRDKFNETEVVDCKPLDHELDNIVQGSNCHCDDNNAHCNSNNTCVCKEGYMRTHNQSMCIEKQVKLGEGCIVDQQCIQFDKLSNCLNNICSCSGNFTNHDGVCKSLIKAKEECKVNMDCTNSTEHSECSNGKCVCQDSFVSSANGSLCLKILPFGQICSEDIQCIAMGPGGYCGSDRHCQCKEHYESIADNGSALCRRIVVPGDKCTDHKDCVEFLAIPSMECIRNQCQCRPLFKLENMKCTPPPSSATKLYQSIFVIFVSIFVFKMF